MWPDDWVVDVDKRGGLCLSKPGTWKLTHEILSPFPVEALRGWWDMMESWAGRGLCSWIAVCKASHQTAALEYSWPLNNMGMNCADTLLHRFFPKDSQPSIFLGFTTMHSTNHGFKTVFSGDMESWLLALFYTILYKGLGYLQILVSTVCLGIDSLWRDDCS